MNLHDFIIPIALGTFAVAFTIGYATYSLIKIALSGEPFLTTEVSA